MKYGITILCILFFLSTTNAQTEKYSLEFINTPDITVLKIDSTTYYFSDTTGVSAQYPCLKLISLYEGICKSRMFVYKDTCSYSIASEKKEAPAITAEHSFLKVHGNVYYDMFYRSNIDTPYAEKDIYQHTISTYLDVTVKDQYPVRIGFTTRFSNSGLITDFKGINLLFNSQDFKNKLLSNLQTWENQQLNTAAELDKIRSELEQKANALRALQNLLVSPNILQKIVELRERELLKNKFGTAGDSLTKKESEAAQYKTIYDAASSKNIPEALLALKNKATQKNQDSSTTQNNIDSSLTSFQKEYAAEKQKADSLQKEINKLEALYQKERTLYHSNIKNISTTLSQIKDNRELLSKLDSMHLPDSVLPKGYKTLLAVKSFGIGRTMVNYSELTAKNISITGIQVEYDPDNYYALASGAVDYQFRDYIINDATRPKQYLNLVRFGKQTRDGNSIILTYYFGKKQLYDYTSLNNTQTAYAPNYNLMGYSIEGKYKLTKNTSLTAEAAKSSLPYFNRIENKQSLVGSMLGFKDRSNEAYSVKLYAFIPKTETRINGYYKYFGANFQSFSLYTSGSTQHAWMAGISQPFFKHKLTINGSLRTNDYSSPYLENYQSNIIFKSIQATLRIRKLPVISVGYFPSSQLIKLSDNNYQENLFYTLTGTISHFYFYHGISMNTFLSYTQFYNKQSDSGFVYFNTKNVSLNHNILLSKFSLNANLSASTNTLYNLYSASGGLQCKIKKWCSVGGSLQYNKQTHFDIEQIGFMLNSTIQIKTVGEFRFLWNKGFIPGVNRQLVQNNIGRVTYYKTF